MLKHETGVLAATTAFGNTVVAAWLIAQRGVNTLVLVHRRQFLATGAGLGARSILRLSRAGCRARVLPGNIGTKSSGMADRPR